MSEPDDFDQELEEYLDGLLNESERIAFEDALRSSPENASQVQIQAQIDASLARLFPTAAPSQEQLEVIAACVHRACDSRSSVDHGSRFVRGLHWTAGIAAAAVLVWGVTYWLFLRNDRDEPFFLVTPVARIYAETVASGFQPYYDCRDEDRFAATFARRQGVPLKLLPLPDGTAMLGLAYPGGISRDTTAMLCHVDNRPVMVFVDRLSADRPGVLHNTAPNIHVFRAERDGLVFYEVTPLHSSQVMEYLSAARDQEAN